ncbi:MAG: T9SS C-terminal target domain-containing protein [Chitinophagia bacterium]|nr:T9SS C-terminal target domain-containing protein [Chitinophagia bacterium]
MLLLLLDKRDNAFLYDVDYTYDPLNPTNPFTVTVNNYSVFANLINNTQSYRNLGGPNMSNFYLLPDNAIQRDPALANGYIISTLYKNKQPFTNNITSCDAVLNPYYTTPYNLMGSPIPFSPPTLPTAGISMENVTVNGSFNNPINSSVEFCENNGKYRLAHNENLYNEIRIYPNPAYSNAVINVKLNDEWIANSTFQLELKNIEGQVLSTSDIRNSNSEFTYTLPSISPGMYFVTLTNASGSKKGRNPHLIY